MEIKTSLPKPLIVPYHATSHLYSEVIFKYREAFTTSRIWFYSYDDTIYEIYLPLYEAKVLWKQINVISVVSFPDLIAGGFTLW